MRTLSLSDRRLAPTLLLALAAACGGAEPASELETAASISVGDPELPLDFIQATLRSVDKDRDDAPGYVGVSFQGVGGARNHLRKLQQAFGGTEVFATNLDTGPARANLRVLNDAARAVSTPEAPFYLYVNTPRLPGFFFDEDVDAQPDVYRAKALRSDGREWPRRSPPKSEPQSFISFSGTTLDVSHGPAVDALMENVARVFRAQCSPQSACVGPLHGFVVIDEAQVSTPYTPFDEEAAHADLVPIKASAGSCVDLSGNARVKCLKKRYPRLKGGLPYNLYVDADTRFSFFSGPKRAIPLYSQAAAASFRAFAAARGRSYDKLPADRAEFNQSNAQVQLPGWVRFVAASNRNYWDTWEDWVFATWSDFLIRFAQEVNAAQAGNPEFKGVVFFQLHHWYAIRGSASEPVSYRWAGSDDQVRTETTVLSTSPRYVGLNPVSSGNDLDRLLASGAFAAFIHETASPNSIKKPAGAYERAGEDFMFDHPTHRELYLAKGALAREVARSHGVLFGSFVRSQYFIPRSFPDFMSAEDHGRDWLRAVTLLEPDIVSTIGETQFVDFGRPDQGGLQLEWNTRLAAWREAYPR